MKFIKRNIPIFITGLVLLIVFIFVIIASQTKPSVIPTLKTVDEADLIASHTYVLGFSEAPLSLATFSNFRNSLELSYLDAIYEVYKENPRYLSIALRPIPQTEGGLRASKAAQIAGDQGKYWDFAMIALENSDEEVNEDTVISWAKLLELDVNKFQKALKDPGYDSIIEADIKDAEKLEISTTPTFFLNTRKLSVQNARDLKDQLEAEIALIKKEKKVEETPKIDMEVAKEEYRQRELTKDEKERIATLMRVKYTEAGWDPAEVQPFKGQTVRWENTTNKPIYMQALDKTYDELKGIVKIEPGSYFEFKFPSGGVFRYQEMATMNWGMVIIDW